MRARLVARVAELADAADSKSADRKVMWVRPPPRAPGALSNVAISIGRSYITGPE